MHVRQTCSHTLRLCVPRVGYSSGRHYWELDVLSMGAIAYAGVAEAGVDTSGYLSSAGYTVLGRTTRGGSWHPRAKGTELEDQPRVPCFKPGDRVGFLLDLTARPGTLEYFLNGKSQGVVHSGNSEVPLPSSGALFPAVSGGYAGSTQFRARFDLPCPH